MKAILISVHAKWCALMMNGIKKIEVRKANIGKAVQKLIDKQGFADIYVYCSKDEYLYRTNKGYIASKKPLTVGNRTDYTYAYSDEGKVLFKFRCYKVEEIYVVEDNNPYENEYDYYYSTLTCGSEGDLLVDFGDKLSLNGLSCLDEEELDDYLQHKKGSAIHISDLEIFDKPKELSEFKPFSNGMPQYRFTKNGCEYRPLTKAPQSFMFVDID